MKYLQLFLFLIIFSCAQTNVQPGNTEEEQPGENTEDQDSTNIFCRAFKADGLHINEAYLKDDKVFISAASKVKVGTKSSTLFLTIYDENKTQISTSIKEASAMGEGNEVIVKNWAKLENIQLPQVLIAGIVEMYSIGNDVHKDVVIAKILVDNKDNAAKVLIRHPVDQNNDGKVLFDYLESSDMDYLTDYNNSSVTIPFKGYINLPFPVEYVEEIVADETYIEMVSLETEEKSRVYFRTNENSVSSYINVHASVFPESLLSWDIPQEDCLYSLPVSTSDAMSHNKIIPAEYQSNWKLKIALKVRFPDNSINTIYYYIIKQNEQADARINYTTNKELTTFTTSCKGGPLYFRLK